MAIRRLKDGRWVCYYRRRDPDGKSRQVTEYFSRGPEGRTAAQNRDRELASDRKRPVDKSPRFAELAKIYTTDKYFSEYSKKHLKIRLKANILPHFGDLPALRIDHRHLDGYVHRRLATGVKASTVRRELTDIKAILNFAVKRNPALIPFNPVHAYSPPRADDDIIIPPSAAEVRRILEHAGSRAGHLVRFIYLVWYLGARPGPVEVFSLTWKSVRFDEGTIRIVSAKKGGPLYRDVPLHPELVEKLRDWHAEDGHGSGPIVHYKGRRIRTLLKSWTRSLRAAGITRRLRPYDLRHHFATRALEKSADPKALAEVMGSASRTIIAHYQHVSSRQREKTVALIPSLDPSPNPEKKADIIDYAKKRKKIHKKKRS